MQDLNAYPAAELDFFEKYSGSPLFKFFSRLRYLAGEGPGLLKIFPLTLPISCVPPAWRRRVLALKYAVDLAVAKEMMPSFFAAGELRFCGFTLKSLQQEGREDEATRVFSAIALIRDIAQDGQYRVKEILRGKTGAVVLDCGANAGFFSLYTSYLNDTARIYALEPSPGIFSILEGVVAENKIANVYPRRYAVGDRNGEVSMLTVEDGLGVSNVIEDSQFREHHRISYPRREKVPMLTLDEFVFGVEKLERVDYIKIDTEGYERQVIQGAAKTIKKFRPVIACSAYHLPGDKERLPRLVLEICPEYEYILEDRGEEDFIFRPKGGAPESPDKP